MKKICILLASIFLLTACSNENDEQVQMSGGEEMRIISLMPSNTEIVAELGETDSLVGITTADDYPENLSEDMTRLDTFALDEEAMTALNPTHIISHASGHDANADMITRAAESTGAEVLVVDDAEEIDKIYDTITDIGSFIEREETAKELNASLQQEVEEIHNQYGGEKAEDKVLILISTAPDIYTAGENTFIDDFLDTLNIDNAFEDVTGYPAVTSEDVIAREPEIVLSTLGISNEELTHALDEISGLEGAAITEKENQCTPDPNLISRPGPRFTEGLTAIAECVYE